MDFLIHIVAVVLAVPAVGFVFWLLELIGLGLLTLMTLRKEIMARWSRWVWHAAGALFCCIFLLVAVDFLFLESLARMALSRAQATSGLTLEFQEARGSFLTGHIAMKGVHVRQGDRLDLTLDEAEIDVAFLHSIFGSFQIRKAKAKGVRGVVSAMKETRSGPSKNFVIEHLELEDIQIRLENPKVPLVHLPLSIPRLKISDLDSREPIWSVLCHSTGEVYMFGMDLTADKGWTAKNVPSQVLGGLSKLPATADLMLACPSEETLDVAVQLRPTIGWLDAVTPNPQIRTSFPRDRFRGVVHISQVWHEIKSSWHLGLHK